MRHLRTKGPSLRATLLPLAPTLDACWWYLGGTSFTMPREFKARHQHECADDERLTEYWQLLLDELVDHHSQLYRIGKPGFFSELADSVDFDWTCLFAIEAAELPLTTLERVAADQTGWGAPFENLPPEVLLVARDIDSAYQDYAFRDEWMFDEVLSHLRRSGHPADEIIEWPTD